MTATRLTRRKVLTLGASLGFLSAAVFSFSTPLGASGKGVTMTVDGLRNGKGTVVAIVFGDEASYNAFDYMKAVDYAEINAKRGSVTHHFETLTGGPYAIVVFHDENKDGDLNFKGERLLEGLGATGAPNPMDEPSFAEASVWPGSVRVQMHYDF